MRLGTPEVQPRLTTSSSSLENITQSSYTEYYLEKSNSSASFVTQEHALGHLSTQELNRQLILLVGNYKNMPMERLKTHAQALIRAGARLDQFIDHTSPDLKAVRGLSAFFISILSNNHELIKFFLEQGADINQTNTWGTTALMTAVFSAAEDKTILSTVKLLIAYGARVNARHKAGHSALARACERNLLETALYLIKQGALVNELEPRLKSIIFTQITHNLERIALLGQPELLELIENTKLAHESIHSQALLYAATQKQVPLVKAFLTSLRKNILLGIETYRPLVEQVHAQINKILEVQAFSLTNQEIAAYNQIIYYLEKAIKQSSSLSIEKVLELENSTAPANTNTTHYAFW